MTYFIIYQSEDMVFITTPTLENNAILEISKFVEIKDCQRFEIRSDTGIMIHTTKVPPLVWSSI